MKRVFSWGLSVTLFAATGSALAFPQSGHPAMLDPAKATEKAPETFRAKFETTKGDIVFECTREWAPNGVDRFYNLVKIGFFDDVAFFRVVKTFVAQWGIHGDPKVAAVWSDANLPADPPKQSNKRGMLTYAMAGRPDTRSTQLFVNFKDNTNLDAMGFAPICKVAEGMDVADKLYGTYGEAITDKQGLIQSQGNDYLRSKWPELDYIKSAVVVGEPVSADRKSKSEDGKKPSSEDAGDKIVFGAIAVILLGGGAFVFFTGKKEAPAQSPKPAPKPAPEPADEPASDESAPAPAPKKKKKPKAD